MAQHEGGIVTWADIYGAPAAGPGGLTRTIYDFWPLLLALVILYFVFWRK